MTLELGGKSPVIVGRSADVAQAAERVTMGKMLNAGQICLAPDYVLAPDDRLGEFVSQAKASVTAMFPTIKDNPDYTAIIADRHYDRIRGYIDDARAKGAQGGGDQSRRRGLQPAAAPATIPPTLIINATDNMSVMQEEICRPGPADHDLQEGR